MYGLAALNDRKIQLLTNQSPIISYIQKTLNWFTIKQRFICNQNIFFVYFAYNFKNLGHYFLNRPCYIKKMEKIWQVKEHIEHCVILCNISLTLLLNKNIKKISSQKLKNLIETTGKKKKGEVVALTTFSEGGYFFFEAKCRIPLFLASANFIDRSYQWNLQSDRSSHLRDLNTQTNIMLL